MSALQSLWPLIPLIYFVGLAMGLMFTAAFEEGRGVLLCVVLWPAAMPCLLLAFMVMTMVEAWRRG